MSGSLICWADSRKDLSGRSWPCTWAYEELGEMDKAVAAYAEFIEGWSNADPEVQPMVDAARARLDEIVRERG